ncbi:hypothetical protein ACLB2K_075392 [Fragaria x ananassa]
MLSWFTLASILLLFTAIPLEANSNQKECGDLNLTTPPFSGTTGKGSGTSLGNNWLDLLCSRTNLEQEVQASSFSKVRVNNSIYSYSNCSFYTGAGAKMLQSHKVHAAMNLTDHTTSNIVSNNFTTVIGYESFGFIGYEPLSLNINSPMADQEDGACSGIGYCHSSIPRRIEYSFAKEAASIVNITLLSMYIWFTMRPGVTGTPSKSILILPLSMVGNDSSARQPHYEKIAVLRNYSKRSVHSLIEVGTRDKLVYHMKSLGFCCLFIVFGITGIYSSVKNQKLVKHKSKFFQKNGGLLLQQHINASTTRGRTTIFTSKELEMTMSYHKKSHTFGPEDYAVQRFVNEIITLTQINHQNMVKFLGCCLETEAPILVYELASSGTLFDYIHRRNGRSSLPWDVLLKIASESAAALAYLHSASIIHGNVKSSNILLTDSFMAKVVGLRPSRLVPSNESQIITLFRRTLGYLDPEYLHKGQLTDKSDVYSFGMVLLGIVTGEKPIAFGRPESQRIISSHFVLSMELQSGLFDQIVGTLVLKQEQEQEQEQVRAVAELAKRCLSLSSAERPAM